MFTRRQLLKTAAGVGAALGLQRLRADASSVSLEVNDAQGQLNRTTVASLATPKSLAELEQELQRARRKGLSIIASGGRHAMGGQQFCADAALLDMRQMNRVLNFDRTQGLIEVEAGIEWPELIDYLYREQPENEPAWAIRQKQSGIDRVTVGGSLASNIHGRGLKMGPLIGDVETFQLLDAQGKTHTCSRAENAELFTLAIGGYGLFGIITHVTLRLVPRTKVERVVEVIRIKDFLPAIEKRAADGFLFGDCQYATDLSSDPCEHQGVFSCYRPAAEGASLTQNGKRLTRQDWAALYQLARTDKKRAFETYSQYYLGTTGQIYWCDRHQLSGDFQGYRDGVPATAGTEVITEIYVGKDAFLRLLQKNREDFLRHNVDMTYGTIRMIEADTESFLRWARQPFVCIICNLHVMHTEAGIGKAAEDFRRMIDRVIEHGGSYYLTYHRFATRRQVESCYPQFVDFLRLKKKYDPEERFQSDWYRHYKEMFADKL